LATEPATSTSGRATTASLGFLLAKAAQRWNDLLVTRFADAGFPEVRASYGSVLLPLFEQDGLRIGEVGRRARLSKPSVSELVRMCEAAGLVARERDPEDGRAVRLFLTDRGHEFRRVAEQVLEELESDVLAVLGRRQRDALARALRGVMDL
jgi:DNA-binding MarR family transcriptional regulator